jgi:hypothetical protein
MVVRFVERTLGYDIRKSLTKDGGYPASVFAIFWPSVFWDSKIDPDDPNKVIYSPFRGPHQNFYDDASEMLREGLALPATETEGSVLIEITELRGVRAINDRSQVTPLPVNIRRKKLIGYDLADYYLTENRGAPNNLWTSPDAAFTALKVVRSEEPNTSAVIGLYELECDEWHC